MSEQITKEEFTDIMAAVDAVHDALERFAPPEALAVLKMVRANLKAEIRNFERDMVKTSLTEGAKWLATS